MKQLLMGVLVAAMALAVAACGDYDVIHVSRLYLRLLTVPIGFVAGAVIGDAISKSI